MKEERVYAVVLAGKKNKKELLCSWDPVNKKAYYFNHKEEATYFLVDHATFLRYATIEDRRNLMWISSQQLLSHII